ncbi:MAG: hypothetical protein VR65_15765 [Desulfobulbaceae bacterium BRH_c16a]|nr:MAG: hypothetical protein VR65_15765 [Desulfobulbaceae bacterium BRH_c16a]
MNFSPDEDLSLLTFEPVRALLNYLARKEYTITISSLHYHSASAVLSALIFFACGYRWHQLVFPVLLWFPFRH